MRTSFRGSTALFILASIAFAAPAAAQTVNPADEVEPETDGPVTLSANISLTSEYNFRGVDQSGGDIALQGGLDLGHGSGFYVGTWASTLDDETVGYGDVEIDVYGGWTGDIGQGLALDVGVIGLLYPDAGPGEFDFYELYTSLGFNFGPTETKIGISYAPIQDSLGGTDNIYVYGDVGVGIPDTPVTVTGHLGYTDGFLTFTDDGNAFDWSIGAEANIYGPLTLSAAYVGAEGDIAPGAYDFVDDAFVVTLTAGF